MARGGYGGEHRWTRALEQALNRRGKDRCAQLRETAQTAFGWRELRPGQLEAMSHVLEGRDTLVVMPTGSGKSAIYQVPALLLDGPRWSSAR